MCQWKRAGALASWYLRSGMLASFIVGSLNIYIYVYIRQIYLYIYMLSRSVLTYPPMVWSNEAMPSTLICLLSHH